MVLDELGRYEEAIASYDRALAIKPDYHKVWMNRGFSALRSSSYTSLFSPRSPAPKNPVLNQRDYKGALASFQEGLRYCHQNTHPEGWGLLHQVIGTAHYLQAWKAPSLRHL
jgi:tetratricopeptide (TPR) repeat protein